MGREGRVESAGVTLATAWGMNIRGGRDKSGSTEEALQWSRMDREVERWMDEAAVHTWCICTDLRHILIGTAMEATSPRPLGRDRPQDSDRPERQDQHGSKSKDHERGRWASYTGASTHNTAQLSL